MTRILLLVFVLAFRLTVFTQEPQSEFVPVTEIPPGEQLPSVPLVIAAYAFVWLAFMAYTWTMWRKLAKVEKDLSALSTQVLKPRTGRGDR